MPVKTPESTAAAGRSAPGERDRNEVTLVGRLAAAPEERELPSGDRLVQWRIVVRRPPEPARPHPTVDTFDCATFAAGVRRSALRWSTGDVVTVEGALRRRFWRSGGGTASRYEVAVHSARRIARADSA